MVAGTSTADDPAAADASATAIDGAAADTAVARAMEWVDAKVPYCQAANHEPDGDTSCAATCTRPDNPAWDPYRSDCSGFVSWAWGLPPPGRTTKTLAPGNTEVSAAIEAAALQPGDAINNDTHTMLFVAWTTPMTEARFVEEPGCSASEPWAREVTASVTLSGQSITVAGYGAYTAIRYTP